MSVGAGSIRRAAKTANTAKKTNVPKAEGKEAEKTVTEGQEAIGDVGRSKESADKKEENVKKGENKTEAAAKKEENKAKETVSKEKSKTEAASGKYETYGIGRQLPTYLL